MENKVYKVVITTVAVLVTVLASAILASLWIISLPLMLIYELVVFLCEYLTGNTTNHNYAANAFIMSYKAIKHIYTNMLDKNNFGILNEY